jgi:lysophospholipase L1-like esterase
MRVRLPIVAMALVVLASASAARAQESFFFKDGDVVAVVGDSITEQRLYSNYMEMWTVTRFPGWKLTFRNVGIGGDTSTGGNSRFKRDVLAYKPTAMTVDFGMNDGRYIWAGQKMKQKDGGEKERTAEDIDKNFAIYMKGLQGMADQARAANLRVAWITPQPIEQREAGPQLSRYNTTLEKFSKGVGEIAHKNGGLFCDQFHPYLTVMEMARESDPKVLITGGDAVHPGPTGQALMAASILKGMHFPREVASVVIDANAKGVEPRTTNCTIKLLESKSGVRFDRLDKALPFFPEQARGILKWTPLLTDMNHYGLQVMGLAPGNYQVRVGGKAVAECSASDLAKGVNLADAVLKAGPIAEQVQAVVKAVNDKTTYFHDKVFFGVVLTKQSGNKELYEERMKQMPELDEAIRTALTMRPYEMEIVPVEKK